MRAEIIGVLRFKRELSRTSLRTAKILTYSRKPFAICLPSGSWARSWLLRIFPSPGSGNSGLKAAQFYFVAEFDARQCNAVRVQAVEESLKRCFRECGVGKRRRMPAPHRRE